MSSFIPNNVVKEIRVRKYMTRMLLQDYMSPYGIQESDDLSQLSILRTEKGYQDIRASNFDKLMETLKLSVDTHFIPCMENQTIEFIQLYETLKFYTTYAQEDTSLCQKGLDLLNQMKANEDFAESINIQLLISQEVVLLEALTINPAQIRQLIFKGLEITYPELAQNPFDGNMLIFEEGPLLHSLARTYMKEGNIAQAKALLGNIFEGLTLLPEDDKEKERMYAPMLLTLVQCHMQEKDYDEALKTCDIGYKIALKRNNGLYTPDFAELKIYCLHILGQKDELPTLILQAYAGYTLLRRYKKTENLLVYAQEHGIKINTYGMETIRPPMPQPTYAFGEAVKCDSVGHLIAQLRRKAGMTLKQLSEGLCSDSVLSKIENGRWPLDKVYLMEAIMQRLGRHIDHYFHTFPKIEDFKNKQARDEINSLLISRNYQEAEELLKELAKKKSFQSGANLQFIKSAEASIYSNAGGYNAQHLAMLHEVLNITRKDFDISNVAATRLTYQDIVAVNKLANNLCSSGEMRKGLRLFEDLVENMDSFYVDEFEKIRMYTTVMRNYSIFLWRAKRYEESLEYAIAGEEMDVKHGGLRTLPSTVINRACSMHCLGSLAEKSLPYFALAFYGFGLVGRQAGANATKKYVIEHLGVDF